MEGRRPGAGGGQVRGIGASRHANAMMTTKGMIFTVISPLILDMHCRDISLSSSLQSAANRGEQRGQDAMMTYWFTYHLALSFPYHVFVY